MELYKHTSVIVIISFAFALGSDDDVQTPRQMVAVGQQIRLECHVNVSGVDWWFRKESNYIQKNPDKTLLVLSGRLTDAYVRRGRIDFGNALILKNLTESDSGVYWCSSDSGLGYNLASIKVMGYLSVEANTKLILPCFSTTNDVDWLFQPVRDVSPNSIYTNGILYAEYSKQGRFNVGRRSPGEFSLEINNITVKESGLYTCHEDSGASPEKHTVRVVVAFYFPLNSDVSLPCQTALDQDVDWRYWKTLTSPFMQHIYSSGIIYDVYQSRHNVSKDVTTGHYNLTIKSLQPDDEGIYACIEGLGLKDKHFMELKIRDTTEISYTNKTLTDVPTVTTASVPTAITTHETPVVPVVRGAGYRLESIGLIFLLVFLDVIAVLAVCFAILYLMFKKRSRHPEDVEVKPHEETQEKPPPALELKIEPVTVDLTSNPIPIEPAPTAAQPTEFSKLNETDSDELLEVLLLKVVFTMFVAHKSMPLSNIVTSVVKTCGRWRDLFIFHPGLLKKIHKAKQCQSVRRPQLINVLEMTNKVTGATLLNEKIFVCQSQTKFVSVYSAITYDKLDSISTDLVRDPVDIAACEGRQRLYIADEEYEFIWMIAFESGVPELVRLERLVTTIPCSLSVSDGRLVVCMPQPRRNKVVFFEQSCEGAVMKRQGSRKFEPVPPPHQPTRRYAMHAVDVDPDAGTYAVCFTSHTLEGGSEICVFDDQQRKVHCYNGSWHRGIATRPLPAFPCHMAVDVVNKRLFVADGRNGCVLLFDTELNFKRVFVKFEHPLQPFRLCYVADGEKLIVCVNKPNQHGYVHIYDVSCDRF